jgi:AcrR family transcriptional regulator
MSTPHDAEARITTDPTGAEPGVPRDRLSRDERRSHLLDVAAELVLAGAVPISMESLARAAGVSKTLPYKHFDNITAVLAALYHREARRLAQLIWQALTDARPEDDLVRVWVSAYFDAIGTHGAVLRSLYTPESELTTLADPAGKGAEAVALVLREILGVDARRAGEVSRMVHGAVVGAAISCHNGEASRHDLEDLLVDLIRAATTPSGRTGISMPVPAEG